MKLQPTRCLSADNASKIWAVSFVPSGSVTSISVLDRLKDLRIGQQGLRELVELRGLVLLDLARQGGVGHRDQQAEEEGTGQEQPTLLDEELQFKHWVFLPPEPAGRICQSGV